MKYTIDNVIQAVEEVTKVPYDVMKGKRKYTNISEARQIAMYLIRRETILSHHEIGKIFNRNHSTVMHNIKKVCDYKKIDKQFNQKFNDIDNAFRKLEKSKPRFQVTDDCIGLFQDIYDTIFVDNNEMDMTDLYEYDKKKKEIKKKLKKILKN